MARELRPSLILLDVIFRHANRHKNDLSIAMLDIDFFKKVNDTYGHDCGDRVLSKVAQSCKSIIRSGDIMGRWGGAAAATPPFSKSCFYTGTPDQKL